MKDLWDVLKDETRRRILSLLQRRDLNAGEIATHFSLTKPTISHHLNILREADLIESKKEKNTITYHYKSSALDSFLESLHLLTKTKGK